MEFEHELIIAFWFSVHNENNDISRHILNMSIYIRQLTTLALFRKDEKSSNPTQAKANKDDHMRRQIFAAR